MSYFGWLDASESDRRKMLDVIDLFQQKETVDELGIGSIRDALADRLSPGTSTIQTRARYFFFIPWIYLAFERRGTSSENVATQARAAEIRLAAVLGQNADRAGTIGVQAGKTLKRLPSAVYWAGMGRLGFRLFDGAQDRYHRLFDSAKRRVMRDDVGDLDGHIALTGNWHPHLPAPSEGFPDVASHALERDEAQFFLDQLSMRAGGTLLHFIVEARDVGKDADFPWEHSKLDVMPSALRGWLDHARCYSEVMHGAALLYNLMLAEAREHAEWTEEYREWFGTWAVEIEEQRARLKAWNRFEFWSLVYEMNRGITPAAREFSTRWIDSVLAAPAAARLSDSAAQRDLIAQRELRLKGYRARLRSKAHLNLWGGASGADQLEYRWRTTRTIARDIVQGLGC